MEGEGQGGAGRVARQAERAAGENQNQQQVLASERGRNRTPGEQ